MGNNHIDAPTGTVAPRLTRRQAPDFRIWIGIAPPLWSH
jgi:hypothetical protein